MDFSPSTDSSEVKTTPGSSSAPLNPEEMLAMPGANPGQAPPPPISRDLEASSHGRGRSRARNNANNPLSESPGSNLSAKPTFVSSKLLDFADLSTGEMNLGFADANACPMASSGQQPQQQQQPQPPVKAARTTSNPTDVTDKKNSTNMSVSEPNLSTPEASAVSLLETFAAVARRRSGTNATSMASTNTVNNSRNQSVSSSSGLFGTPKSVSSLVRLALSSNFPTGLLNAAQSHPTLNSGVLTSGSNDPNSSAPVVSLGGSGLASNVVMSDTDQVSLEEFLESFRDTSLLADLEEDEDLPDAEDDNDDDNDDDDEFEDNFDEEFETPSGHAVSSSTTSSSSTSTRGLSLGRRKIWDDEHVLKRKFSALIPAFDPRPGRTNINQTSDIEVPSPDSISAAAASALGISDTTDSKKTEAGTPKIHLMLRGPNLPGVSDIEIDLTEPDWTVFKAVQYIIQASNIGNKSDKLRRVWEPSYVIVYREVKKSATNEANEEDVPRRSSSSTSNPFPQLSILSPGQCSMDEVLQLIRQLYLINTVNPEGEGLTNQENYNSKKITNKLVQQIQDPLVLSANAMPDWCQELTFSCPMLFPFETRLIYFHCTAFGASRSIVWLQNQRDNSLERSRGSLARGREDIHEFRVGRIKHERVKVPRGDRILDWAVQVMRVHADRKAILEVEFIDEEGTGLGPTLEFFALVASELQRKDLCLWMCDDVHVNHEEVDMGEGKKPPGFYVMRPTGLFPAPLPQDSELCERVSKLFWFLGVFLAKTLQDNRLVDLPLSYPFLKLLCQGEVSSFVREKSLIVQQNQANEDELMSSSMYSIVSEESEMDFANKVGADKKEEQAWFASLLGLEDLAQIDSDRGEFLKHLQEMALEKQNILARLDLSEEEKQAKLESLTVQYNGHEVGLEDLGLNFQYSPPSKVYGFAAVDLVANGEHEAVTIHNLEDYIQSTLDFVLHEGIRKQMNAFRSGFNHVFPLDKLGTFNPLEVRTMICGEQCPIFTREEIIRYTEPKLGYTRESETFLKFVNVLVSFTASERKAFLQFTTGCSSLPPGEKEHF